MESDAQELRRCFDLLDLRPNASWEEAKTSYQELLRVWEPERFGEHDPLRARAAAKTAALNAAMERLRCHYEISGAKGAARARAVCSPQTAAEKPLPNPLWEALSLLFLPFRALNTVLSFSWRYALLILFLLFSLRFLLFAGLPAAGNLCSLVPLACQAQKLLNRAPGGSSVGGGAASLKNIEKALEKVAGEL